MSITRSSQKVVDAVDAALAIKNTRDRIAGSLEYPWYLPYNILLNDLVADSNYVAISAQYVFSHALSGEKAITRIPDYVIIHTNVSRNSSGTITGIKSTVCAVVEIKALSKTITKEEKDKGVEGYNIKLHAVEKQIVLQTRLAMQFSPKQNNVIAILAVGQFWKFLVYKRAPTKVSKDGLPVISPVKISAKKKRGGNNLLALVRKGSELADETINACNELKMELKNIIGRRNW